MSYITWNEIGLDQATLIQLTDDEGAGSVSEAIIAEAIADAEAEVDSYASSRYSVPFSSAPAVIKSVVRTIAQFNLFSRRVDSSIPEALLKRYERAVAWLKDLSTGRVSLDADTSLSEDERTSSAGVASGGERTFGRDNLEDY